LKKRVTDHCAAVFAKYELPDDVLVWKELPLTGTGKLDKKNVRAALKAEGYILPSLRAKSRL
jgi:acyl-CoA synthetase (AMP-forming)/AMP-acid ligase II